MKTYFPIQLKSKKCPKAVKLVTLGFVIHINDLPPEIHSPENNNNNNDDSSLMFMDDTTLFENTTVSEHISGSVIGNSQRNLVVHFTKDNEMHGKGNRLSN